LECHTVSFSLIFLLIFINHKLYLLELNTEVEQYLDEHIIKSFTNQSTLLTRMPSKNLKIKRKMSVKGAIKKTRSFMLDGNFII
jgi:phosphorylase kinase alpha/beta subunit